MEVATSPKEANMTLFKVGCLHKHVEKHGGIPLHLKLYCLDEGSSKSAESPVLFLLSESPVLSLLSKSPVLSLL